MTIRILDWIEWTDPIELSNDVIIPNTKHCLRSDITPQAQQFRLISLEHSKDIDTAIAEFRYLLYKPALSSINGYEEEYDKEIEDFYIVDATICELACSLGNLYEANRVWYLIKIDRAFNLKNISLLIPNRANKPDRFRLEEYLEYKPLIYHCRYKQWLYFCFNDDYWGCEFILLESNNQLILCLFHEWYGSDEDASFITNYQLTKEEKSIINALVKRKANRYL